MFCLSLDLLRGSVLSVGSHILSSCWFRHLTVALSPSHTLTSLIQKMCAAGTSLTGRILHCLFLSSVTFAVFKVPLKNVLKMYYQNQEIPTCSLNLNSKVLLQTIL